MRSSQDKTDLSVLEKYLIFAHIQKGISRITIIGLREVPFWDSMINIGGYKNLLIKKKSAEVLCQYCPELQHEHNFTGLISASDVLFSVHGKVPWNSSVR